MKHIRNFSNVICMEANENCCHTNCFLAPIILMKIEREGFKGLYMETQSFCDVKYLIAYVFRFQVYVQFFSFATIATKKLNVLS
jgi:hypothetical protein